MPESTRRTLPHSPIGPVALVSAYESTAGDYVFVESGNDDGWIASDHMVDVSR